VEDPQVIFSQDFSEKYGMDYEKCWVVKAESDVAYEKLTEAAETSHWDIIRPFYTEDVEFDSLTNELRSEAFDEYLTRYLTPGDEFFDGDFEYYDLERRGYLVEEALRRMEAASEDLEAFVRNFANLDNVGVQSEDELVEYGMSLPLVEELEDLEGSFMVDTYQRKLSDYGVLPIEFKKLDPDPS
jgi:hypothetical protein